MVVTYDVTTMKTAFFIPFPTRLRGDNFLYYSEGCFIRNLMLRD